MRSILFLMFVATIAFCFFLYSLWTNHYSPIDVLGIVASTASITCLFCAVEEEQS